MFLIIFLCDSSIDNFREHKSSRTFYSSQKLSTELSSTQIVRNIQLLSDTLNITIIYAHRQNIQLLSDIINWTIIFKNCQELSTVLWNESSWQFVYMVLLLIISVRSWMFLIIFLCDSSIDNFREKLNVLDDLCIKNIQLFSEIVNITIIYTKRQEPSTVLWYYQ
jgi:hypothetical protein